MSSRTWRTVSLGAVCIGKPQYGFTASASVEQVGPKFLRTTDIVPGRIDWSTVPYCAIDDAGLEKYRLVPDDIVISRMGTVGVNARITSTTDSVFASYLVRFRANRNVVDPVFLSYVLKSRAWWEYVDAVKTGAVQPNLNAQLMSGFEFPLPSLDEQHRISSVLSGFDQLIDIDHLLLSNMELVLAKVFEGERFDRSGSACLGDIIDVAPTYPKPSGQAAHIEMAALSETSASIGVVGRRPATGGARFMNGDTLVARITPCLENGKVGYVDCLAADEVGVGSTEFIVLRAGSGLPSAWPYFLARSPRFREYAIRHMSGTSGRQRCPAGAIAAYPIEEPTRDRVERFALLANSWFPAMRDLRGEARIAEDTRNQLLPLLLSGAMHVSEVAS